MCRTIASFPSGFREEWQCKQKETFCNCTGISMAQCVQELGVDWCGWRSSSKEGWKEVRLLSWVWVIPKKHCEPYEESKLVYVKGDAFNVGGKDHRMNILEQSLQKLWKMHLSGIRMEALGKIWRLKIRFIWKQALACPCFLVFGFMQVHHSSQWSSLCRFKIYLVLKVFLLPDFILFSDKYVQSASLTSFYVWRS